MSKHSIHLRLETLKNWLEQTNKNSKYGRPKKKLETDSKEPFLKHSKAAKRRSH